MGVSSPVPFAAVNLRLASSEASAAHTRASRYALKTTKIALLASCTTTRRREPSAHQHFIHRYQHDHYQRASERERSSLQKWYTQDQKDEAVVKI